MANKTRPTDVDVHAYLDAVEHPVRQADARVLLAMLAEVSGESPRMWGPSLIGFGSYHYRYDSGREGDFLRIGFAPRKARQVLYIMPGFEEDTIAGLLERLGKHKVGKGCLYINKLADVDLDVLRELIAHAWAVMAERYPEG